MTGNDDGTKTCQIDVLIEEHEEKTRVKARLSWAGKSYVGVGLARLDPADEPVGRVDCRSGGLGRHARFRPGLILGNGFEVIGAGEEGAKLRLKMRLVLGQPPQIVLDASMPSDDFARAFEDQPVRHAVPQDRLLGQPRPPSRRQACLRPWPETRGPYPERQRSRASQIDAGRTHFEHQGRALVIGTGPVGHRVNERSGLVEDARPEIGQPIHLGEPVVHVAQGHGHVVIRIRACIAARASQTARPARAVRRKSRRAPRGSASGSVR